jgi:hypothetical protein
LWLVFVTNIEVKYRTEKIMHLLAKEEFAAKASICGNRDNEIC